MTQDLDKTALQALLDALGPTPAEAGAAYEGMRERLIRFFRWNRCMFPDELADIALDRLADKLSRGAEPILFPARFVTGIARMLLLEQRAKETREKRMLLWLLWSHEHRGHSDEENRDITRAFHRRSRRQGHPPRLSARFQRCGSQSAALSKPATLVVVTWSAPSLSTRAATIFLLPAG